ncbi:MAG: hypothetical protein ACRENP_27650 [Longimicrobiales bacterium]
MRRLHHRSYVLLLLADAITGLFRLVDVPRMLAWPRWPPSRPYTAYLFEQSKAPDLSQLFELTMVHVMAHARRPARR